MRKRKSTVFIKCHRPGCFSRPCKQALSFPSAVRPDMRNHRPAQPSSLEFWRDSNIFQFINLRSFPRDNSHRGNCPVYLHHIQCPAFQIAVYHVLLFISQQQKRQKALLFPLKFPNRPHSFATFKMSSSVPITIKCSPSRNA